jgi:CheY-like chemotaxis protein
MPVTEWEGLRQLFLEEGIENSRELLTGLDKRCDVAQMSHQVREWVGNAGQLGFHGIAVLASDAEQVLNEVPLRKSDLRRRVSDLLLAFADLRDNGIMSVPRNVAEVLRGKRVALIGLPPEHADRACAALGRVEARARIFAATDDLDSQPIRECDLLVVQVRAEADGARLQAAVEGSAAGKLLVSGEHWRLMALPVEVQTLVAEYLADNWEPEEMLLRLTLAILRKTMAPSAAALATAAPRVTTLKAVAELGRPKTSSKVLIVDDDRIVLSLVRTTLQNYGMRCETVNNGNDALRLIRQQNPDVVVLDVNMPGLDGYEVLSRIREENLPTLVVLVTARQQEHDVLRGFQLGADDYLVKPFNPPELVARIKRLLRSTAKAA